MTIFFGRDSSLSVSFFEVEEVALHVVRDVIFFEGYSSVAKEEHSQTQLCVDCFSVRKAKVYGKWPARYNKTLRS